MIVTLSFLLFWLCMLAILATVVISFINRKDYGILARALPFYGAVAAAILTIQKKNPKIAKMLMYGAFGGAFIWFFIYDWIKIVRPSFDWIDYGLIAWNPFLLVNIGLSQLSETPAIMGVFWNPVILISIGFFSIVLFEIFRFIMNLVYEGVPLLIKILVFITSFAFLSFCAPITNLLSLISAQEFVFTSPYLFISGGDIIDAMFVYLKEFLGIAFVGMFVAGLYDFIIKIINGGWKYIMKRLISGVFLGIISIYPLITFNSVTDILFAYLYELLFISISWMLFLSPIFTLILRIIRKEWKYIIKQFIIAGLTSTIVLLVYLLTDGSIDPKSLKYGVTETISKIIGTGMGLVVMLAIGFLPVGIMVLEIRTFVFKYSN